MCTVEKDLTIRTYMSGWITVEFHTVHTNSDRNHINLEGRRHRTLNP